MKQNKRTQNQQQSSNKPLLCILLLIAWVTGAAYMKHRYVSDHKPPVVKTNVIPFVDM